MVMGERFRGTVLGYDSEIILIGVGKGVGVIKGGHFRRCLLVRVVL